jgi:hypothetical protein
MERKDLEEKLAHLDQAESQIAEHVEKILELASGAYFPFREIANRHQNSNGAPYRDVPRTLDHLLQWSNVDIGSYP